VVVRRQYRNARRHAAARRSTAPLGEDERAEGRSEGAVLVGDLRQPEGRGDLGLRRLRVRGRAQHRSDQCLFGLVHAGVSQSHPGAAPGGGSMNPEIPTILELSMQRLAGNIGEGGAVAQRQGGAVGKLVALSAKEYERGADIRVAENTELRTLFGELAGVVTDAGLKAKLVAAAASKDASLRISVLNENNYALRRLLTEAMIHVELHKLRAQEQRIWTVLKSLAARRLVQLGP